MDKKKSRQRRARRTRAKIKELGVARLTVHRTPRHIYAQVISHDSKVVASASTVISDIKSEASTTGNVASAVTVGKMIAERAKDAGVSKVAFDRSGFRYHGRVKAFAETLRKNGMEF